MATVINTYTFSVGLAALLHVQKNQGPLIPAIYLSKDNGVVVGQGDMPLQQCVWPLEVKAEINCYFNMVFSLQHEDWKERSPSPRAVYVDSLQPWSIQVEEHEPNELPS